MGGQELTFLQKSHQKIKKKWNSSLKIHLNNMLSCKMRCRLWQINMDMSSLTNVIIFTEGKRQTKVSTIEKNIDASMNYQYLKLPQWLNSFVFTFKWLVRKRVTTQVAIGSSRGCFTIIQVMSVLPKFL